MPSGKVKKLLIKHLFMTLGEWGSDQLEDLEQHLQVGMHGGKVRITVSGIKYHVSLGVLTSCSRLEVVGQVSNRW